MTILDNIAAALSFGLTHGLPPEDPQVQQMIATGPPTNLLPNGAQGQVSNLAPAATVAPGQQKDPNVTDITTTRGTQGLVAGPPPLTQQVSQLPTPQPVRLGPLVGGGPPIGPAAGPETNVRPIPAPTPSDDVLPEIDEGPEDRRAPEKEEKDEVDFDDLGKRLTAGLKAAQGLTPDIQPVTTPRAVAPGRGGNAIAGRGLGQLIELLLGEGKDERGRIPGLGS